MVEMDPHQIEAVRRLRNRGILRADVGAGKSRIAIYYHLLGCGGSVRIKGRGEDNPPSNPRPLYIITTAKKRDTLEWEAELAVFGMQTGEDGGWNKAPVVVDSWNNIKKYEKVHGASFIFDEQRLVGSGAWVKAFYRIARKNRWIILTATPGDDWRDYIPVFVANGFYRSKAEFLRMHAVYNTYATYPKIDRWVDEERLEKFRKAVLVEVDYATHTKRHLVTKPTEFDLELFDLVKEKRWNPWEDEPIKDAGEMFRLMRRVSNEHSSRVGVINSLYTENPRLIVFYNFNYELDILREWCKDNSVLFAEWNGHKHEEVPKAERWVYLVQYTAGSEGWNCVTTDTIVFYSLPYSYKAFKQAQGRIDRMNTPFTELFYYVLRNQSWIDQHVWRALMRKKTFNESAYLRKLGLTSEDFGDKKERDNGSHREVQQHS